LGNSGDSKGKDIHKGDMRMEERNLSLLDQVDVVPRAQISLAEMEQAIKEMQNFVNKLFVEGEHYGTIIKGQKPTLLKPGAELLLNLYGYGLKMEKVKEVEDWDKPFFYYEYKAIVYSKKNGWVEAEGFGSANSKEKKFAFDKYGNPQPPEYIYSMVNSIQKIAQKRALVAPTLIACRASALFTQDLEDMGDLVGSPETQPYDERKTIPTNGVKKLSEAQVRLLYGKAKEKGLTNEALHKMISEVVGKESVKDIDRKDLEVLLDAIQQI